MRRKLHNHEKAFLVFVSAVLIAFIIMMFALIARGETEETWDQWGDTELPYSSGKPWEDLCKDQDIPEKKCGNMVDAVKAGESWGKKSGYYHRKHSYRIYFTYKPWLVAFGMGVHGLMIAQTCRTESEGEADSVTKSVDKEAGLCSINRTWAKKLNVNSCDPKANLWAAGWMRNFRLLELRQGTLGGYMENAEMQQQWFLAGAAGAVGGGKLAKIISKCGLKKSSVPYDKLGPCYKSMHAKWKKATEAVYWVKKLGLDAGVTKMGLKHEKFKKLEPYSELYDQNSSEFRKLFFTSQGYNPWLVVFRTRRHEGVEKQIAPLFPSGQIPWGSPALPPRPPDLYPYPGDTKHGNCGLWPELKDRVPTEQEWASMVEPIEDARDPATLRCVSGYKGKLVCCVKDPENEKKCLKEPDDA